MASVNPGAKVTYRNPGEENPGLKLGEGTVPTLASPDMDFRLALALRR
jgi:hypothetical protein